LLGVHSRYGLHTRAVTVFCDTLIEGWSWRQRIQYETKSCELLHVQIIEGQQNPVGQINIARANKTEPYRVIIQIPPNILLSAGVRRVTGDKTPAITPVIIGLPSSGNIQDRD
jgi:invasion protein IalB